MPRQSVIIGSIACPLDNNGRIMVGPRILANPPIDAMPSAPVPPLPTPSTDAAASHVDTACHGNNSAIVIIPMVTYDQDFYDDATLLNCGTPQVEPLDVLDSLLGLDLSLLEAPWSEPQPGPLAVTAPSLLPFVDNMEVHQSPLLDRTPSIFAVVDEIFVTQLAAPALPGLDPLGAAAPPTSQGLSETEVSIRPVLGQDQ